MSEDDFRETALALDGVVEGAHMGHPDFRVNHWVFASLRRQRCRVSPAIRALQGME